AAGISIDWQDFSELSAVVPQLSRVYPNGTADVNHFHAAGGLGFMIADMLENGLLHPDVNTILGNGLENFCREPLVTAGELDWRDVQPESLDTEILRSCADPFNPEGGLRLVTGDLGRAIVKVSAVDAAHRSIEAPARVFRSQQAFVDAFNEGKLEQDFVAVVTHQGPRANGMPELHKLTPYLGVLQNRGFRVALLTDGRMSGASGKVLAAIHVTPEAADGGLIARVRDGDIIRIDAAGGVLALPEAGDLAARGAPEFAGEEQYGMGRELFAGFRSGATGAEQGASQFGRRNA
ncbi:MAG: dihydroxy-acid dehydratase, partial [Gammaproteobacteria bacterium]|nr:dihydroxy-acid dehydratase [Gammaproteobacteria bacterium]